MPTNKQVVLTYMLRNIYNIMLRYIGFVAQLGNRYHKSSYLWKYFSGRLDSWPDIHLLYLPLPNWFQLVRPSVRPFVYPSVARTVSAPYLPWYLPGPLYIYTFYQPTSEGVPCALVLSKFENLNLNTFLFMASYIMFWSPLGVRRYISNGLWY